MSRYFFDERTGAARLPILCGCRVPVIAAYVILTVVLLWVGNAGAKGSLTPNGAVGVRTTETRKSLQAWTRAQRVAKEFNEAGAL